jgi:hypothetical protein
VRAENEGWTLFEIFANYQVKGLTLVFFILKIYLKIQIYLFLKKDINFFWRPLLTKIIA